MSLSTHSLPSKDSLPLFKDANFVSCALSVAATGSLLLQQVIPSVVSWQLWDRAYTKREEKMKKCVIEKGGPLYARFVF